MIFTDPILNSNFTIYLNIYENFLFTAMKIVQYVIEWGVDVAKARAFLEGGYSGLLLIYSDLPKIYYDKPSHIRTSPSKLEHLVQLRGRVLGNAT